MLVELLSHFKGSKKESDDEEYFSKAEKRAKKAEKLFKKAKYVPLGMLCKESDPNYLANEPKTQIHLSDSTTIKAKDKYTDPSTWPEFCMLFDRLIRGYTCIGSYKDKASILFEYKERLSIHHTVSTASVSALVAYDKRVRSRSKRPFDWIKFDYELFEIVKAEFPKRSSEGSSSWSGPNKRLFGSPTKISKADRTANGLCHAWSRGVKCRFTHCRFSHWCLHPKCVDGGSVDHRADECPNGGGRKGSEKLEDEK